MVSGGRPAMSISVRILFLSNPCRWCFFSVVCGLWSLVFICFSRDPTWGVPFIGVSPLRARIILGNRVAPGR